MRDLEITGTLVRTENKHTALSCRFHHHHQGHPLGVTRTLPGTAVCSRRGEMRTASFRRPSQCSLPVALSSPGASSRPALLIPRTELPTVSSQTMIWPQVAHYTSWGHKEFFLGSEKRRNTIWLAPLTFYPPSVMWRGSFENLRSTSGGRMRPLQVHSVSPQDPGAS